MLPGLPGLQGLRRPSRGPLLITSKVMQLRGYKPVKFFETLEHLSQVTRLQGFEGYMVTELQNPPHILPYLSVPSSPALDLAVGLIS